MCRDQTNVPSSGSKFERLARLRRGDWLLPVFSLVYVNSPNKRAIKAVWVGVGEEWEGGRAGGQSLAA